MSDIKTLDGKLSHMMEYKRTLTAKDDKGERKWADKQMNATKYQLSQAATVFLRNARKMRTNG